MPMMRITFKGRFVAVSACPRPDLGSTEGECRNVIRTVDRDFHAAIGASTHWLVHWLVDEKLLDLVRRLVYVGEVAAEMFGRLDIDPKTRTSRGSKEIEP